MKFHVHYEAAFQKYLQTRQIPYVAVDESKRAAFRDAKLKSFDFIVYSEGESNWLIDIKGRRWAARSSSRRPTWENWVTEADLAGLRAWEQVFGPSFRGLLVFAYWIAGPAEPPPEVLFEHRDQRYVFCGIPLEEYCLAARLRSPRWGTVNLPVREFQRWVRPLADWV